MVGRAVRRGGCSTSVCWHLLSSSKRRMADAACQAALIPLCRLAPPSTCLVWLGRGHEGDHHRDPQFTDCVRMVLFMRNAIANLGFLQCEAETFTRRSSGVRLPSGSLQTATNFTPEIAFPRYA